MYSVFRIIVHLPVPLLCTVVQTLSILHQKGVLCHQLFVAPLLPSLPDCILLPVALLYPELSR